MTPDDRLPTREQMPEEYIVIVEERVTALVAENARLRSALTEIAQNKHGFHRPAGAIARVALKGDSRSAR